MLYIMRHGKTDWNTSNRLQGRTDIPLNDEGRRMAEHAREEYRDISFDICFTSPLRRASETAEIVLHDRNIPIIRDERLREMSFGIWEGVENSFLLPDCPVNVLFRAPEEYIVPVEEGESFDELFTRTGDFLREEINPRLREGKDILIVGHGAMNCAIICQIRGLPLADFWSAGIENCKLMRLI